MSKRDQIIAACSCVVTGAGAIWAFIDFMGISMSYGVGASGAKVPPQHVSLTVFPLPILAILLGFVVVISNWRRAGFRTSLWFAVPAIVISALIILLAVEPLP